MPTAPLPRPEREPVTGFSIPFQFLRHSTHHLWRMLGEARNALPKETERIDDSNPLVDASVHWETYALAVQVFAGMTVESVLNTYGLVRFGEQQFRDYFQMKGPVARFKAMMEWGPGLKLNDGDEVVRTLSSLAAKRNLIVHMQSDEEVFDQQGKIIRPAPPPLDELAGAKAAIQEMDLFLRGFAELIGKHDIESWMTVAPL